ncbi:uncharacterized protein LOC135115202 isoform X3 [Scylla paramamosain]
MREKIYKENVMGGQESRECAAAEHEQEMGEACLRGTMDPACKGGKAADMEAQKDSDKGYNPEECPVCISAFDDVMQRPRNLPCGHTFCTSCINGLKELGHVTCPNCRLVHVVPDAGQFPISYITEDFIRRLRGTAPASLLGKAGKDAGEPVPSLDMQPDVKGAECLSRAIRSMLQEQEEKVLATIRGCQELQVQLDHYQTSLGVWGEQQQHLEDRLQTLVDRSKGARLLVRQEEAQVEDKRKQVQQGEQQQHLMLRRLRSVTSRQEAFEAIDDADLLADQESQRTQAWQEMFPKVPTVATIRKMRVTSRAALKAVQTMEAALDAKNMEENTENAEGTVDTEGACGDDEAETSAPAAPPSTILTRLEALLAPTLEAEDLYLLMPPTRSLLEAGLVFATHTIEGEKRYAQVSLQDDCLYLHSLQDQRPPPRAAVVPIDEVVPVAPPCLVFLDLTWPDSPPCRVLVRLIPDTPLGRQFIWLCTGERGPCYANTTFFHLKYSGQPGERVSGGDYERNNGKGGSPLLPDLDKGDYRESRRAGAVHAVWRGDDRSNWNSNFGILIKDLEEEGDPVDTVFGEIEAGMEGVMEAAKQYYITDVVVKDCGVVLWAE